MKILKVLGVACILVMPCLAQVNWSISVESGGPILNAGDSIAVNVTATINPGWHITSLTQPDGGPIRTQLALAKAQPFKIKVPIVAPSPEKTHSDAFDMEIETYEGEVVFKLLLEALSEIPGKIELVVEVTYQACSEENCMLPITKRLSVPLLLKEMAAVADAGANNSFARSHQASELIPDSQTHYGALPSGLRYVIRPNTDPRGCASLRLLVLAGSFNETETQRGLAHFLEHMAFNGSKHFPAGSLVEALQRLGMSFGADTNAHTGFDRTVYQLELPDTKSETLAKGFTIFADYAARLDLSPEKIEKERGIILSEKRTRDSVGFRTMLAGMDFSLGGTLLPQRLPIGLDAVIEHAPRSEFLDYDNTWYLPERMVVVAVGDFDAREVEDMIRKEFSEFTARAPARADATLGQLAQSDGLRVRFHAEPEAGTTTVTLSSVTPYSYEPDTAANRLAYLPRSLAFAMLNRRLSILAKQEGVALTSARGGVGESFDFYREATISATCKPEQWSTALAAIEQELRRAIEHGFRPEELREVIANFSESLEQGVATAASRRSAGLANALVQSVIARNVFTSPETERDLFQPALQKVTAKECSAALRATWHAPGQNIFVTGNARIEGDQAAALTAAYQSSRAVAVMPLIERKELQFAYGDFGPAGKIVKREHVADLDITQVEFANGVRLNLKKTDFEAGRIGISVRVGTGQLTEPREQPGLATFAHSIFLAGGLEKHSADDLRQILAGKVVGINFGVGDDALQFSGGTNQANIILECQLLVAQITEPGYRPEAVRLARKGIEQFYTGLEHAINRPFQQEVPQLLSGGDSRFGVPARDALLGRTVEEVKAWLGPQLERGALEVGVVGDFDVEATIAAIAKTFGALPAREAKPALAAQRKLHLPAEGFVRDFQVKSKIPKGIVSLYWPTTDARDVRVARRLSLLADIITDRLRVKVREEIGAAYSPSAASSLSDVYTAYGHLIANLTVEPMQAEKIATAVKAIAADLADHGVIEDEITRAKQPLLTQLRESTRTNGYWLGNILSRAQERPEVLDWSRTRLADYEAITKAELDALAKRYLQPSRASRFISLPIEKIKEAATEVPAQLPNAA